MDLTKRKDYSVPMMEIVSFDFDDVIVTSLLPDETDPIFKPSGAADQQDIYNIFPKGSGY